MHKQILIRATCDYISKKQAYIPGLTLKEAIRYVWDNHDPHTFLQIECASLVNIQEILALPSLDDLSDKLKPHTQYDFYNHAGEPVVVSVGNIISKRAAYKAAIERCSMQTPLSARVQFVVEYREYPASVINAHRQNSKEVNEELNKEVILSLYELARILSKQAHMPVQPAVADLYQDVIHIIKYYNGFRKMCTDGKKKHVCNPEERKHCNDYCKTLADSLGGPTVRRV